MNKNQAAVFYKTPKRVSNGYQYEIHNYVDGKIYRFKDKALLNTKDQKARMYSIKTGKNLMPDEMSEPAFKRDPYRIELEAEALALCPGLGYMDKVKEISIEDLEGKMYLSSRWLYENGL